MPWRAHRVTVTGVTAILSAITPGPTSLTFVTLEMFVLLAYLVTLGVTRPFQFSRVGPRWRTSHGGRTRFRLGHRS